MSERKQNDEASSERAQAAAAALTKVVVRLAAVHLDETVEPEHYGAALRALAEPGPRS